MDPLLDELREETLRSMKDPQMQVGRIEGLSGCFGHACILSLTARTYRFQPPATSVICPVT